MVDDPWSGVKWCQVKIHISFLSQFERFRFYIEKQPLGE